MLRVHQQDCCPALFLSNWCDAGVDVDTNEDAEADADSSKTICLPPPCGGWHNYIEIQAFNKNGIF